VPDGYLLVDQIEEGQVVRRYVFDPDRERVIRTIAALALNGATPPSPAASTATGTAPGGASRGRADACRIRSPTRSTPAGW